MESEDLVASSLRLWAKIAVAVGSYRGWDHAEHSQRNMEFAEEASRIRNQLLHQPLGGNRLVELKSRQLSTLLKTNEQLRAARGNIHDRHPYSTSFNHAFHSVAGFLPRVKITNAVAFNRYCTQFLLHNERLFMNTCAHPDSTPGKMLQAWLEQHHPALAGFPAEWVWESLPKPDAAADE